MGQGGNWKGGSQSGDGRVMGGEWAEGWWERAERCVQVPALESEELDRCEGSKLCFGAWQTSNSVGQPGNRRQ